MAALACGMDAAKAVLRKSDHLLPPSSACRLLVAALLDGEFCCQALHFCEAHAACASL